MYRGPSRVVETAGLYLEHMVVVLTWVIPCSVHRQGGKGRVGSGWGVEGVGGEWREWVGSGGSGWGVEGVGGEWVGGVEWRGREWRGRGGGEGRGGEWSGRGEGKGREEGKGG